MIRGAIPLLCLLAAACETAEGPRTVRYDLEQIAAETLRRDTSPGFSALPAPDAPLTAA